MARQNENSRGQKRHRFPQTKGPQEARDEITALLLPAGRRQCARGAGFEFQSKSNSKTGDGKILDSPMRFGRQNRVRLARDFKFVKLNSAKADCSAFVFYARPAPENKVSRIAVVASKKTGCAVERNSAKRKFRAIFRECAPDFPQNADILIFVRPGFKKFPYSDLKEKFARAALKLLSEKSDIGKDKSSGKK